MKMRDRRRSAAGRVVMTSTFPVGWPGIWGGMVTWTRRHHYNRGSRR